MSVSVYIDYIMLLGASAALIKGRTEKTRTTKCRLTSLGLCKWHCQSPWPEWVRCTVTRLHSNRALLIGTLGQACRCRLSGAPVWKENVAHALTSSTAAMLRLVPVWTFFSKQNRMCHFRERTFCIKWAFRISSIHAVVCQTGIFLTGIMSFLYFPGRTPSFAE